MINDFVDILAEFVRSDLMPDVVYPVLALCFVVSIPCFIRSLIRR